MFVMRCRRVEEYFEVFADIEKKDGHKKFYEQFGKFLKFLEGANHEDSTHQTKDIESVRFSNSKSEDALNRLKFRAVCREWLVPQPKRLCWRSARVERVWDE